MGEGIETIDTRTFTAQGAIRTSFLRRGVDYSKGYLRMFRTRAEFLGSLQAASGVRWASQSRIDIDPIPSSPDDRLNLELGGFQLVHTIRSRPIDWVSQQQIILPFWFFLPAVIPPLLWRRRWRRNRGRGFPVEQINHGSTSSPQADTKSTKQATTG